MLWLNYQNVVNGGINMEKVYIIRDEEYLEHHGIKGQKWGIRRYQNDDGTFTDEGKKRYGIDSDGKMSKEGAKLWNQDRRSAVKDANKDLKEMSLKTNNLFRSYESNQARYSAGKLFVSEKYGPTTLKDYKANERKKTFFTYGASIVASMAALIGTAAVTINLAKKLEP